MRWLLYAAGALVFLAGLQLTVFSEQTSTYFAWTIAPPLTAAFLGASYWAAVPVEILAARQSVWAKARVAVPAIWLFTTLTFVATLLHFDRFHFSSPIASAQGAAWFWLAIYAGVPVAMALIGWIQIRRPGGDPPLGPPAPLWMRIVVLGQGAGMLVFGAGLFLAPAFVGPLWPWTLTGGYIAFGALQLVALARFPGDMHWDAIAAWVYVAFIASVLPVGLFGWFGPRQMKTT
jgi:hypothetical protein